MAFSLKFRALFYCSDANNGYDPKEKQIAKHEY